MFLTEWCQFYSKTGLSAGRSANVILFNCTHIQLSLSRAQSTARLVGEASGHEDGVELREGLYLSGPKAYLEALRQLPAEIDRAMIVGHNPDVEELVHLLTGRDEPMPTAALAHVELSINGWNELDEHVPGKLANLWRPRDLPT